MAIETVYIGRYRSATRDSDYGDVSDGTIRTVIFESTSQDLWGFQFGLIAGYNGGGSAVVKIAAYRKPGSALTGAPMAGHSADINLTSPMTYAGNGQWAYGNVAYSTLGPLNSSIAVPGNSSMALGILVVTGNVRHNMAAGVGYDGDFYDAGGYGTTPPNNYPGVTPHYEGNTTVWLKCHVNEPPRAPVNRSISGDIDTLTPTFSADFRDRNGAWGPGNDGYDDGDRLKRVQVQIMNDDTSSLFWDKTYSASGGEITANRQSTPYTGPTMTRGVNYSWRSRHTDQFDAWGDYSAWLPFRVVTAGSMVTKNSPTGTIQATTPAFLGRWSHATALSTNAVNVRIKQGETVIATSGLKTKTVANNTDFTFAWADTGLSPLGWGLSLTYELQGRDTGGVVSSWSAGQAFKTDSPPSIPSGLSPTNGAIKTAYPLLTCICSDLDDNVASGFGVKCEIIRASDSVLLGTYDMGLKAGTSSTWQLQTTATHIPAYQAYRWRAYGYDGTIYSGGVTVEADATRSDESAFSYLLGPTVTMTYPVDAGTFGTATPVMTWNAPTQAQKRVWVYKVVSGVETLTYVSSWVVSTNKTFTIPSGKIAGNGSLWRFFVEVKDGSGLIGDDSTYATLVYTPADAIDSFVALPYVVGTDDYATTVRMTWTPISSPDSEFLYIQIDRSDMDMPLVRLPSTSANVFLDYSPPTGDVITYTIQQVISRNGETIPGITASDDAQIIIQGVVLHSVANPGEERLSARAWDSRRHTLTGDEVVKRSWSGGPPTTYRDPDPYWTGEVSVILHPVLGENVQSILDRCERMANRGGPICLRDSLGQLRFYTIVRPDGFAYDVLRNRAVRATFQLREEKMML